MTLALLARAVGLFAVTNIDDILILTLFFARTANRPRGVRRVVAGQYLGFTGILALALAGAAGATLLPDTARPYLGLLPLVLGIRAALTTWRERHKSDGPNTEPAPPSSPNVLTVAAVTFANGGDNIGVYVPVFTTTSRGGLATYLAVFLLLLAVWCAAARYLTTRPLITRALSRWGHLLLPLVLIGIGLAILTRGDALGGAT